MAGSGSGSPCGACKFLRRKCMKGCVFAPYFCHEQGASHFAAIHKVFGASNASKLLSHLPAGHRSEAAVTISYEAQARLQDPVYGCVSHIFALQQQVVTLQAQLTCLKEQQAAQGLMGNTSNPKLLQSHNNYHQDLQSWFHDSNPSIMNPNPSNDITNHHQNASFSIQYGENEFSNPNPNDNSSSYGSFEEHNNMETPMNFNPWPLEAIYVNHS